MAALCAAHIGSLFLASAAASIAQQPAQEKKKSDKTR